MATIDVGSAAIDRGASTSASYTFCGKNNAANGTGTIDHCDCYISDGAPGTVDFASFVDEGSNVLSTNGSSGAIAIADGLNEFDAPGDFSAFNINSGEYIGGYGYSCSFDYDGSGGGGQWWTSGDRVPCSSYSFSFAADDILSIYGTGTTVAGWVAGGKVKNII